MFLRCKPPRSPSSPTPQVSSTRGWWKELCRWLGRELVPFNLTLKEGPCECPEDNALWFRTIFLKRISCMTTKVPGEFLISMKTELDIAAIMGDIRGAEKIIPDAQRQAKVHPIRMLRREFLSMMPDMHFRIVEDVTQRAISPA